MSLTKLSKCRLIAILNVRQCPIICILLTADEDSTTLTAFDFLYAKLKKNFYFF